MNHEVRDSSIARALRAGFPRGGVVVAGVSGGGDSMAMLHALCTLAPELDLTVIAAHFDHQLRPHSHLDADLVFRMAHRWGARIAPGRGDVRTHALLHRQSREAAGRELRYAFLERVADEAGADAIATAHTRDDQVETVLMRVSRGAGARGCRGILAQRGRVVRPLLAVTRSDAREYCRAHGVPYVDDPSNESRDYERNRVRHDVLPELRRFYPGIDEALVRIGSTAEVEFARAERAVGERIRRFLRREADAGWILEIDAFTDLDREDCSYLINAALEEMNARTDVGELHHEMVLDLIGADVGTISYLPGLRVRREHDGIVFAPPAHALPAHEAARALQVPGTLDMDGWHMEARRVDAPASRELSNNEHGMAYIPCDDIVVVRYPREGDRIQPFGMDGHKKLSDVFIDRKIPKRRRAATPVVEVDGEIVWVVGVATSEKCRVTGDARNLVRLTATRREP